MQTVAELTRRAASNASLPVDPDVQVPAAVRRAAEAANAAQAQIAPQPPAAPPAAPLASADQLITIAAPEVPRLPGQVPLTISPAPQPPTPADPPSPPAPQNEEENWQVWKNRYESMLGRFRDANAQLLSANGRIEALENMLASRPQPASTAPAPTQTPSFITKKDEEEMGPEMIDFVRRAAREVAAPYEAEIASLKAQLGQTQQVTELTARQRMHADLDRELPNWDQINHDPEFHAWLALQDPYSGATRKSLLTQAYAQNHAARVLAIFKGFVSETAALQPSLSPTTVPTPAPQPDRPSLESLAAPGRARTAAPPQAPAEKQIIRTSDINAFYAAVRRGAYRGREALQAEHEAELTAAMREGRVVQDT